VRTDRVVGAHGESKINDPRLSRLRLQGDASMSDVQKVRSATPQVPLLKTSTPYFEGGFTNRRVFHFQTTQRTTSVFLGAERPKVGYVIHRNPPMSLPHCLP
jgi:hypothetical protein